MDSRRSGNFQYYSLLFPFCCLALGFVVNVLTTALIPWMPYTVMMMLVGLLVGLLHRGTNEGLGVLSDSISSWDAIDPHLLMYAFLPPLLFGDSMNLNYHHVKECFAQCFLLAGPGVVIGTGLMGLVAKWVLPYNWDWKMSMCFAAITAATDPVAVVGLLNQLGASKKLTMVIAGESLMNDGIAIVAFTLFKNLLHGQSYDFWGVVEFFFQVALGGPAVGLAFGIVALMILIVIKNYTKGGQDNLSNQTTLTFVVAYLSFFVGEEVCEVSGVLACVVCGVVIAAYGWPLLTAMHEIHHVWHVVEFMGNTIVFMLSGIIIASDIYSEYEVDVQRTQKYFGYMIVVYLFMVIIRGTVILILYPALNNIGYELERGWRDALVATWGGLRGAVGLVLCLIIDEDSTICNEGAPFVVLIGGATFYTLVINGVTTGPLLKALSMLKDTEAQTFLDFNVQRSIHKKVKIKFDNLSESHDHRQAIPEAAKTLIEILGDTWTVTNEHGKKQIIESLHKLRDSGHSASDSEEICQFTRVFRDLYLEMVRAEYWHMIHKQLVPITSSVPGILLGSIDMGLDEDDKHLADWNAVEESLAINWWHKLFDENHFAQKVMHQFGRLVARDRNAHILDSYVCAHEHAWEKFKVTMTEFEQLCKSKTLGENTADNGDNIQTVGAELAQAIQGARENIRVPNEENLKKCHARIKALEEEEDSEGNTTNSDLMTVLCTKRLAGEVLHFQQTELDMLRSSAVLSSKGHAEMVGQIEQNISRLQNENIDQTSHDTAFESHSQSNIATVMAPIANSQM